MRLTEYTLANRTVTWMVVALLALGGVFAFNGLGRLEDPHFTIKQAMVVTRYPGASSQEVEEEVTLPIENAIQQLPYVEHIVSTTAAGLSQVEVEMKSIYRKDDLAQIWDEMRRKINDMEGSLPPGASAPMINDDFADVYGMFYAVTGEGYSFDELADYTDYLRRELAQVDGVGKVIVGGRRIEQVFIEVDRAKLAASGFSVETISQVLQGQNLVSDAGHINIGREYLRVSSVRPDGEGLQALRSLLLGSANGQLVFLTDVATISKGYREPPSHLYRFNGKPALTLGVSFGSGVNVVEVGAAIKARLQALEYAQPLGVEITAVYDQPGQVNESVSNFLWSLAQAVVIVVLVLMVTMGLKPGIIMSATLLLTIAGTFIAMNAFGIELHRISLGALIIALGMLVDNAIVVTEGIMINVRQGMRKTQAAIRIVSHTRWPLLGATIIAITAFAPIGLSPDASGEFTGSLFWVLLISLFFSWVLAVTLTPFFCFLLLGKRGDDAERSADANAQKPDPYAPYQGKIYRTYRKLLHVCLHFRALTLVAMLALLVSAIMAFSHVNRAFFPDSSLPMFMVDYWLPEGSAIRSTEADVKKLEADILKLEGVKQITSTIGRGAERFMLTYAPEKTYPSYAQLMIETDSFARVATVATQVKTLLKEQYPQAFTRIKRTSVGPTTAAKIEARLSGPDPTELRRLGEQMINIFTDNPHATNVRQNWRERTKVLRPVLDAAAAQRLGITQADLDNAIKMNLEGVCIGVFRQGADLLPIIIRPPANERHGVDQLDRVQVYSPISQGYVNVGQFVRSVELDWENPLIMRRDKKRTLAVLADPTDNSNPFDLLAELRGPAEALQLPLGYSLEWGGEHEAQAKANKAVFAFVPIGVLVMIMVNIIMFNSLRQTLVIWLTVPLAIVGVAWGLLVAGAPFSFTALLAVLSLVGMQIKNGIVLVEEIKRLNDEEQIPWSEAISLAAVSRLRPVSMAALTTILGMLPLLTDVFFKPMAVTIMAGLGFATILTLIVVPVLFALFYRVRE
jgi:multidrug efflux pump subunit AcrB